MTELLVTDAAESSELCRWRSHVNRSDVQLVNICVFRLYFVKDCDTEQH